MLFYFILFYLTISITYRHYLPYIFVLSILRFSPTNSTISHSSLLVLLLNERLDFNREIMEFQPLFPFSFVLGSVFHEDKVSSLSKFEGVSHKGIHLRKPLIAFTRKYLKRIIMCRYGHPGWFNPAVLTNKEGDMIYGNMNNETGSSQAAGFHEKTSRKFLPHQRDVLVKCN